MYSHENEVIIEVIGCISCNVVFGAKYFNYVKQNKLSEILQRENGRHLLTGRRHQTILRTNSKRVDSQEKVCGRRSRPI